LTPGTDCGSLYAATRDRSPRRSRRGVTRLRPCSAAGVSAILDSEVREELPISTRPFTYVIDYAGNHMGNAEWDAAIEAAPPGLLHVGHDIPVLSVSGPTLAWDVSKFDPASPEQVRERMAQVREFVERMRGLGAVKVIPYIVNCILWGDHETRKGFWHFYDHWNEYAGLGLGTQPPQDPVEWQQEQRRAQQHAGGYWYTPCPNNPHFQRFLDDLGRMIARCGYHGLFMDVNTCWCFCSACQADFRRFMADRYSPEELRRRFGVKEIAEVSLRDEAPAEYAAEVDLFRAESVQRNLRSVRNAGQEVRPDFLMVANIGPMGNFDGFLHRTGSGKSVLGWARACDYIMFEEWLFPGEAAPGVISDQIMQYKLAFDLGGKAVVLDYKGGTPATSELAWAESAAFGGGGAFVNPGTAFPEARAKYDRFWTAHPDLYEGYETHAEVGVPFLYDRILLRNVAHLRQAYRLTDALARTHLLFEFLPSLADEERLARLPVVILPAVDFLRPEEDLALRKYVERGGVVVALGSMKPAEEGTTAQDGLLALQAKAERDVSGALVGRKGAGRLVLLPDPDAYLPESPFALWQLTEDEMQPEGETERRAAAAAAAGVPVPGERLVGLLRGLLGGGACCQGPGAESVRLNAFLKAEALVLHLVNYAVPLLRPQDEAVPSPAGPLRVRLPLPPGLAIAQARAYSPDEEERRVEVAVADGAAEFEWSSLKVYGAVRFTLTRG